MNGLGNEIVIVDLRRAPDQISAAEAIAAARHEPYDQLMALYPARGDTDAFVRIYNNDGSEAGACGNGMRCVAALVSAGTGRDKLQFETPAGLDSMLASRRWFVHRGYGRAAFALGRNPAGAANPRYARDRSSFRPDAGANPAIAVRCQHG